MTICIACRGTGYIPVHGCGLSGNAKCGICNPHKKSCSFDPAVDTMICKKCGTEMTLSPLEKITYYCGCGNVVEL